MKVGSLVVAIEPTLGFSALGIQRGMPIKIGDVLTIREIGVTTFSKIPILMFEEIKNQINEQTGCEFGYHPERFRQLLPPISNIEIHIKENTLEPELI